MATTSKPAPKPPTKKSEPAITATATLQECLALTMADVGYIQKDASNDFQHYRYASATAVLKKVNTSLSANGVCLSSEVQLISHDLVPGLKRPTHYAVVKIALTFQKGDEKLTVEGIGGGSDTGDKSVMKASTAALKYCLANAFLISWGDDPEADTETDRAEAQDPPPVPPPVEPPPNVTVSADGLFIVKSVEHKETSTGEPFLLATLHDGRKASVATWDMEEIGKALSGAYSSKTPCHLRLEQRGKYLNIKGCVPQSRSASTEAPPHPDLDDVPF